MKRMGKAKLIRKGPMAKKRVRRVMTHQTMGKKHSSRAD